MHAVSTYYPAPPCFPRGRHMYSWTVLQEALAAGQYFKLSAWVSGHRWRTRGDLSSATDFGRTTAGPRRAGQSKPLKARGIRRTRLVRPEPPTKRRITNETNSLLSSARICFSRDFLYSVRCLLNRYNKPGRETMRRSMLRFFPRIVRVKNRRNLAK